MSAIVMGSNVIRSNKMVLNNVKAFECASYSSEL